MSRWLRDVLSLFVAGALWLGRARHSLPAFPADSQGVPVRTTVVICDNCKKDLTDRLIRPWEIFEATGCELGRLRLDVEACSVECLVAAVQAATANA